jgi:hypothetical protein
MRPIHVITLCKLQKFRKEARRAGHPELGKVGHLAEEVLAFLQANEDPLPDFNFDQAAAFHRRAAESFAKLTADQIMSQRVFTGFSASIETAQREIETAKKLANQLAALVDA